jgi:hypothetical protein
MMPRDPVTPGPLLSGARAHSLSSLSGTVITEIITETMITSLISERQVHGATARARGPRRARPEHLFPIGMWAEFPREKCFQML